MHYFLSLRSLSNTVNSSFSKFVNYYCYNFIKSIQVYESLVSYTNKNKLYTMTFKYILYIKNIFHIKSMKGRNKFIKKDFFIFVLL